MKRPVLAHQPFPNKRDDVIVSPFATQEKYNAFSKGNQDIIPLIYKWEYVKKIQETFR